MPAWLKGERDAATKQNLLLLQRYLEASASSSHVYPATGQFTKEIFTGFTWPDNSWTGQAMAQGTALGDYSYTQKDTVNGPGTGYVLSTQLSNRDTYKLVQSPVGAPLLSGSSN
jgi:hypothetical protein